MRQRHKVTREMRAAFCGDDNCTGTHREPYAVCSCGWSEWVGNVPFSATTAEERREYDKARERHLSSAKEAA